MAVVTLLLKLEPLGTALGVREMTAPMGFWIAVWMLILGLCSQTEATTEIAGQCRHYRTGEPLTQVRDTEGKLWDVTKLSYPLYPSAELTHGCSIPWEAKVETDGYQYIAEYIDETGKVIHTETRLAEWVFNPDTGERVDTAPVLPDRVLRLVEYRWH